MTRRRQRFVPMTSELVEGAGRGVTEAFAKPVSLIQAMISLPL